MGFNATQYPGSSPLYALYDRIEEIKAITSVLEQTCKGVVGGFGDNEQIKRGLSEFFDHLDLKIDMLVSDMEGIITSIDSKGDAKEVNLETR